MLRRHLAPIAGLGALLALAAPSLASAAGETAAQQAAGTVIVRFAPRTTAAQRAALLARVGAVRVRRIRDLGLVIARVTPARRAAALATLRASGATRLAEPDRLVHAASVTPTDPHYADMTWPYDQIYLPDAWGVNQGAASVVVAVLDTGVNAAQTDLAGGVLAGTNIIDPTKTSDDDNGHGTEVATVLAGRMNNGFGSAGACPLCDILPVKVLDSSGSGSVGNLAAGITWAVDHGANIINMSLGGPDDDPALEDAIAYAEQNNVLPIAAAGNSGSTAPEYPAAIAGVVGVAATDQNGNLYSWSEHGQWVDVAAPGCVIASTKGNGITTACGTSFASPLTAGAAGLVLAANPGMSAAALKTSIEQHALQWGIDDQFGEIAAGYMLGITPAAIQPRVAQPPYFSGIAQDGQSLIASTVIWASPSQWPMTGSSRQWQSCDALGANCVATGQTGTTYTLTSADIGRRLKTVDTGTNTAGSTTVASVLSEVVVSAVDPTPAALAPTPPPATSTPVAIPGIVTPTPSPLPVVAPPPLVDPVIWGTAAVGSRLSADPGSLDDDLGMRVAFQWQVLTGGTWQAIPRQTDQDFDVPRTYGGKQVRVLVTAVDALTGVAQQQAASDPVTIKAPPATRLVKRKLVR